MALPEDIVEQLSKPPMQDMLNLGNLGLTDDDVIELVGLMREHPNAWWLELSDNQIGDRGAKALAEYVQENPQVLIVNLTNNQIGDDGALAFAPCLHAESTLGKLILNGCPLTDASRDVLHDRVVTTRPKNLLDIFLGGSMPRPVQQVVRANDTHGEWWTLTSGEDFLVQDLLLVHDRLTGKRCDMGIAEFMTIQSIFSNLPTVDLKQPVTLDMLTEKDSKGFTPLDNPALWHQLPELQAALSEPLSKEFLLTTTNRDGDPVICNAICAGATAPMLALLESRGERLEPDDITDTICDAFEKAAHWERPALFRESQFESPTELAAMKAALDVDSRQIPNYHALSANLSRQARLNDRVR